MSEEFNQLSKPIPYFACICCGEDRSHPADMMGITKEGDLWCWDCPGEEFAPDDPDKPVLKPFVPEWVARIAELEAKLENLDSVVTAHWDVLPLDFKLIYGANKTEAMEDTQ